MQGQTNANSSGELTRSKDCVDSSFVQKFIILRWNYSTADNNDISKQEQWNNEIDYINMSEWVGRRRREREFFIQPYPLPISFIWAMSSGRSVLWPAAWELIPTTCTSASTACCATSLGVWKQCKRDKCFRNMREKKMLFHGLDPTCHH